VGDELVCDERPCLPERPIVECPDDPLGFETTLAKGSDVLGDKYHVEVMGPGGCASEDYVVCYSQLDDFGEIFMNVLTPPDAAACDSVAFQTFDVDLTPLASLLEPGSGLIELSAPGKGYVTFGELSCADHQALASLDITAIDYYHWIDGDEATCETHSDCVGVWGSTSCTSNGCVAMATNVQDSIGLRAELASIDQARCGPFFDAGCTPPPLHSECEASNPPAASCLDGRCVP
jgi:hypothetical protein